MIHILKNFYAIPLHWIVWLIILGLLTWILTGGLCLRYGSKSEKVWRILNKFLCVLSGLAIIKMTLIGRVPGNPELELRPFYLLTTAPYYNEAYRTLLMNVFLFFPLGLTLPWAIAKRERPKHGVMTCALIGMGISIVIECLQFVFGLGRAETDDVICNTLGCIIGLLAYIVVRWKRIVKHEVTEDLR